MTLRNFLRFIIVVLLEMTCVTMSAQQRGSLITISGKVFDGSSGEALSDAFVYIKEKPFIRTSAGRNGEFTIKALRGDKLVFSFWGYPNFEYLVTTGRSNLAIDLNAQREGQQLLTFIEMLYINSNDSIAIDRQWMYELHPKEIAEKIQKMYWDAMNKKDYGQAIKAVVYRMQNQLMMEENVTVAWLDSLKQDAVRLPQPARSVVHSLMADVYRDYYQQNKSTFRLRTSATTSDDDIETWDIRRIFEEALHCYRLSIADDKILKQTPIDHFQNILLYCYGVGNNLPVLPTLYDLLVYRAIQAYSSEMSVALPQQTFVVDQPAYFADIHTFTDYPLSAPDTLSAEYIIISLYQQLLRFRLQQPDNATNRYALIHLDWERLRYVSGKGKFPDSDQRFEKALIEMIDRNQPYNERYYPMITLALYYKNKAAEWRKNVNDELRSKYCEAWQLCEQIAESDDSVMVSNARSIQEEIKNPTVELHINYLQYPGAPILAHVTYRNIKKAYLYFCRLTDDEMLKYNNNTFEASAGRIVKKQTVELPSQSDFQKYSTEIKVEALPQGSYVVLASDNPNLPEENIRNHSGKLTASALIQVSSLGVVTNLNGRILNEITNNLPEMMSDPWPKMMEVMLTDNITGEPVKDGVIDCYCISESADADFKGSYTTNANGMAYISFKCDGGFRPNLVAKKNDKKLVFTSDFQTIQTINPINKYAVLFTDRSIYRPGQTVFFKALCLEDNLLLTEDIFTVSLLDVNRQTLESQDFKSGEYGTFQGSFIIPQGLLNGLMTLTCSTTDNKRIATKQFRVEEYKRPTFVIDYEPVKGNYRLNDSVLVHAKANAYAGYAIDNAIVTYRVVRNEIPRYRYWWMPHPVSPQREIASGKTVTGSDGSFSITFKAQTDDISNSNLIYNYTVTADVTDANGETRSAIKTVKIGNQPLLVEIDIPQQIINHDSCAYNLKTTNLNGDFTPAQLTVTLNHLQGPSRVLRERRWPAPDTLSLIRADFEKFFPFDVYGDEDNPVKYPVVNQLTTLQVNTANDKKLQLPILKTAKAGWYRLDFKAHTPDNIVVEDSIYFRLTLSPDGKMSPIISMKDWVTVVKDTCFPGENMEFFVAGSHAKSHIIFEVISNKRVMEQKHITTGTTPQRIEIPVKEEHRGGIAVQFVSVQNQRDYSQLFQISVPYKNKQLDVAFATFRDRLQPGEHEQWRLTIKDIQGEKQKAEMVATLYDASLDAFERHSFADINRFYTRRYNYSMWRMPFPYSNTRVLFKNRYEADLSQPLFPLLSTYPLIKKPKDEVIIVALGSTRSVSTVNVTTVNTSTLPVPSPDISSMLGGRATGLNVDGGRESDIFFGGVTSFSNGNIAEIATRRNFNETAFFYPQLHTNENGEIAIEFTVPETLTRWKMLGFAHTKDLKVGNITSEFVTQKKIAISANAPRFFREGDVMEFTAKVNNIANSDVTGQALLQLYDAATMQPYLLPNGIFLSPPTQGFNVKAGESVGIRWKIAIPFYVPALAYKVTAQAGDHTDGEEKTVPVLSNKLLVAETMPFSVRAGAKKTFTFKNMKDNKSTTLRNHKLTLEMTSIPAWHAIQSLPFLMEYPHECAEQLFSRFYANSLASSVANSSPHVKEIFDLWQTMPEYKDVLLSNLEKNRELKQVLLEETPWVMQAQNETERKKRVGLLFDLNRMSYEQQNAFDKLRQMQLSDGGFPWFTGLPASRYITEHIVTGIGHLQALNALDDKYIAEANTIANQALNFLDACIWDDYYKLLKAEKTDLNLRHTDQTQLHYLYACSFTKHKPDNDAFSYYYNQAILYWKDFNLYGQAMIALTLHRYGDRQKAADIMRWLKKIAQQSEEMGMYWKDNKAGYFWHQAPIETQALLIEAFDEITNDANAVNEMKIWLLRNKQTNDWRTTKATAEACFALLKTGGNLLDENLPLNIKIGGSPLASVAREDIRPEPGTGFVKTAWNDKDIRKEMAVVDVSNPNKNGIAWGGVYWQYFEQIDKVVASEKGNLHINKQLFLKRNTERGAELQPLNAQNKLKVGNLVTVRLELRADRDYEFVHLKDMRAASLEPTKALSGYRYQDGIYYYENIKDASTNFFISRLPKGIYVFEYELRVTHAGEFSNGITSFQCMYAPEISAHREGDMIMISD